MHVFFPTHCVTVDLNRESFFAGSRSTPRMVSISIPRNVKRLDNLFVC